MEFVNKIVSRSVIGIIILILGIDVYCQKLVQDTLIVSFQPSIKASSLHIPVTIEDQREAPGRYIGRDETTHYFFIPVDRLIYTEEPLSREILAKTRIDSSYHFHEQLHLNIHYFRISEKSGSLLYPHYQLNASFSVFMHRKQQKPVYLGDLLYDTYSYKSFFSSNKKRGFSRVLGKWHSRFIDDINSMKKEDSQPYYPSLENLRSYVGEQKPLNMIIGGDIYIGSGFYVTDMQVFFSHQEAGKWFIRSGGYNLRYRNMKKYEAIEAGLSLDRLFYRLNDHFLCTLQSHIMIGINRWKHMDTGNYTLYDIFLGDISLSQSIQYNSIDQTSFIIGAGIYEELIYNYTDDYQFNLALLLKLGIKL